MKIPYEDLSNLLLKILKEKKRISYKELVNICNISLPTIKKCAFKLQKRGMLVSIYGGIELVTNNTQKITEQFQNYQAIAQYAATLIEDDEVLFLGPGKTVAAICDYLYYFNNLTIFTNSICVVEKLSGFSNIHLIVIGGVLQRTNMSLLIYNGCPEVYISKCFIGCSGIDINTGIFHNTPVQTTEELITTRSKEVILLVDQTKFGLEKAFILMPIDKINTIITNHCLEEKYIEQLNNRQVSLNIVNR